VSGTFGSDYAGVYDLLYDDKDYSRECDAIAALTATVGRELGSVLDLGCGTGGHAFELARRGVSVVGVDLSASMIDQARKRAAELAVDPTPTFVVGDLRTVDLDRRFDAAVMMFAVLGYQIENDDVLAALRAAWRHLAPGGLLFFDVWYGPAVLAARPGERVKTMQMDGRTVVRRSRSELDTARQVCEVSFDLSVVNDSGAHKFAERHEMRFFFSKELELALTVSGFRLLELRSFDDPSLPAGEDTWNVLAVARRGD
jgi:SAM-dependent methyltransferase